VAAEPVRVHGSGTAALSGVVLADDGSGRPVRRATVTLGAAGLVSRVLLSDDDGRFAFTNLPAATYSVTVRKPGWITGYHGAGPAWQAPGVPLVLADGERRGGVELRLPRGGVIAGRLVDELGHPVAGARVLVLRRQRRGGRDVFSTPASLPGMLRLTDDRGEYRIADLSPGDYVVAANVVGGPVGARATTTAEQIRWVEQVRRTGMAASAPPPSRGETMTHHPTFFPGVSNVANASVLSVRPGEELSGVDIRVGLSRSVALRGTLRTPDGVPAAGVPVQLLPAEGPSIASMLLSSNFRPVRTSPDGSFLFDSVPPGDHLLIVRSGSSASLWAHERLSVGDADVSGLEIRLQPGLRISGRVATESTRAATPDLSGIFIGVIPDDDSFARRVPPAPLRPDRTFEIAGLAPGRYLLSATFQAGGRAGGARWIPNRAVIGGQDALLVPFDLVAGRDLDEVVVELAERPASLTGVVASAAGEPVRGLTMVLFSVEQANWTIAADARSRRTAPLDERGRFRFDDLPAGEFHLAALADPAGADLADPGFLAQVAAGAIRVTLIAGRETVQDVRLAGG
jgi:hypothetical protein